MKTRGLKEAREKLGNIDKIIDNMLKRKKKVRIFESGCGYGRLMMDLVIKYKNKVDITGMNLKASHGNKEIMIANALKEKIITKKELKKIKLPKIIYGDVGEKIPLKTRSIDLVLSQVSSYLYKDKAHFFEEVARILGKNGIGLITSGLFTKDVGKEFLPLLKIYRDGKAVSFERHIKKFRGIRMVKAPNGWKIIEIKKTKLDLKLKLEASINCHNLNKKWFGTQSIYYVK